MNNNRPKLEAALDYVRRGWFVIPLCWPTADGKCACHKNHVNENSIGKAPLLGTDYQHCRSTEEEVRRWWTTWPQANIGILLGPSGLLVVDTDSEEAWKEANAKGLPAGLLVRSGKGRHLYYRAQEGVYGRTARRGDARTIDVLASGYVVAPPSLHRSGDAYRWLSLPGDVPLQDAPAWSINLLMERRSVNAEIVELPADLPPVCVEDLPLSKGLKELIRDGLLHHPSRSEAVFAVETAMIEAGCADAAIASVLLDPANGISDKPREQGRAWLEGEIGRARAKAEAKLEEGAADSTVLKENDCFDLLDDEEIEDLPSPEWLIDGILPTEALAVLYGPPEACKTFLGLDWSLSIRSGQSWCGRTVKEGAVVYVYAEGKGKLKLRTRAWKQTYGVHGRVGVKFLTQAVRVLQQGEAERLLRTIRRLPDPPKFIVIDTLARCIQGGDENSAKDISGLIGVADRLREEFKATVLIIHHPGKSGEERGSSALRGAADTMIEMTKKNGRIILSCEKQKDAAHFKAILLEADEVDLGGGDTSCVLKLADDGMTAAELRSGFLNENQRKALQALLQYGSHGAKSTEWRKAIPWPKSKGIPKTTFGRIRKELVNHGYVNENDQHYSVTLKAELILNPIPDQDSEVTTPSNPPRSVAATANGRGALPQLIVDTCEGCEDQITETNPTDSSVSAGFTGPHGSTDGPQGLD